MTLECNANASPGNNQTIETQTLLMYLWPWPANPLTLKHNTHIYERRRFGVISFSRFILSWEQTGKTKAVMRCPSWWWLPKRSACIESAAVAGSNYGQYHVTRPLSFDVCFNIHLDRAVRRMQLTRIARSDTIQCGILWVKRLVSGSLYKPCTTVDNSDTSVFITL